MNTSEFILAILRAAQHTIIARVVADPELRYFQSGSCKTRIKLACNTPGAKQGDGSPTDWFIAELWNEDAQQACDSVRKGDMLLVTGRITSDTWTTNNGEERTDFVIKAVSAWRVLPKLGQGGQAAPAAPAAPDPFAGEALPF